jgi:ABC-type multidrug transport system ATPase subunit
MADAAPTFSLDDVTTAPEPGHPAVEGVTLSLGEGGALALVGPNGSGKTTILRLLAGVVPPIGGRVTVFGQDLATLDYEGMRTHRTRVGLVFEAGSLLANRSIRDNIALPFEYHSPKGTSEEDVEARVASLAEEFGMREGLDAIGGTANASVARAALFARALVLEPQLLLVDEPQSSLAPRQRARIADALQRRRRDRGMTVVFADHDGALAPFLADRRLYVVRGKVYDAVSALGDDADLFESGLVVSSGGTLKSDVPPREPSEGGP